MKRLIAQIAVVALGLALAGTAAADPPKTTSFDPQTGTGFVTKDAVQTAFDWSQSQFARNSRDVTFTWDVLGPSLITCSSGASGVFTSFHSTAAINYELKGGYVLTGYGPTTVLTSIPHGLGAPCPIGAGVVTEVFDEVPSLTVFVTSGSQTEFLFGVQ